MILLANLKKNKKTNLTPALFCEMISEQYTNSDRYHKTQGSYIYKAHTLSTEDIIKNSEIILKNYNIEYISNDYTISFKLNNWFCRVSKIENNPAIRFFEKVTPKITSILIEKVAIVYWEDEEVEYNLLNIEILYNLFKSLYKYSDYVFEDLTLNDLYFSKKHNRFIIKDFRRIFPLSSSRLSILKYFPENILFNTSLFVLGERPASFNDLLQFSDSKKILK